MFREHTGAKKEFHSETYENYTLQDGSPLYYALVSANDVGIMSNEEAEQARKRIQYVYELSPNIIRACDSLEADKVRQIIEVEEKRLETLSSNSDAAH